MTAFYNEIDPKAAAWLRELIKAGHIAPGIVDERDIRDIRSDELAGFVQCHFFAGIGTWSYALRQAGWDDSRPVWTASCPCQPFSQAGTGGGIADERHLWPALEWHIGQLKPPVLFAEQVASKDGLAWLDIVQSDLENSGYAVGAFDLCAAGFGAPHIRQRLYIVADANDAGLEVRGRVPECANQRIAGACGVAGELAAAAGERGRRWAATASQQNGRAGVEADCATGLMADTDSGQQHGLPILRGVERDGTNTGWAQGGGEPESCGDTGELGIANSAGWQQGRIAAPPARYGYTTITAGSNEWPGPVNGFWANADWIGCTDGKWRPVGAGTFPLSHGAPARVVRLRGYGNGIVASQATAFIEAYMQA